MARRKVQDCTTIRRTYIAYKNEQKTKREERQRILAKVHNWLLSLTYPGPWLEELLLRYNCKPLFRRLFVEEWDVGDEVREFFRQYNGPLLIIANHLGLRDHPAIISTLPVNKVVRTAAKSQQFER